MPNQSSQSPGFSLSSAIKIATGNLDLFTSESPSVCTRSQSLKTPALVLERLSETPAPSREFQPKPPSHSDFKIPENKDKKKSDMPRKTSKTKIEYNKMTSDTPPGPSRSASSSSLNKEPCNPPLSLKQVEKMTDREMIDHLTKNVPELRDEALFLYQCPEKIGLEPLRDILLHQTKTWKQATIVIKALVTGLQHRTYLELLNDMKSVMTESTKLMTGVSQSLSETLRSENKESGKTLSALKEVLGNAHELTKTLIEGKTHGHLQVPSKPKRPLSPE